MDKLARLKREAKALHKAHMAGDRQAVLQTRQWLGPKDTLKHADFLHAVARSRGFESWPKLKVAVEADGLSRAEARERLRQALHHGHKIWVDRLLEADPDLARDRFELSCALYDLEAVRDSLRADPRLATQTFGAKRPLLHLAFSRFNQIAPERASLAVDVAALLVANGADVNDSVPMEPGAEHRLPALYGALGHAVHLPLARWLLANGANPNDNESLYHATEQRDGEALRLLAAHGAEPAGTNALFRAMDFDDTAAVTALLDAGADPDEGVAAHPSGEAPVGLSAFHHAVERRCGPDMFKLLIARGARVDIRRDWLTACALARAHGQNAAADLLAAAGAPRDMPEAVARLSEGRGPINPERLPLRLRSLANDLAGTANALPQLKSLVAAGLEWDAKDPYGMTPVQTAGWFGLAEKMGYLLSLKPDLSHVNGHRGTLLSTIIHGSENAPTKTGQDHIACLELALREGVALPEPALRFAGREDVVTFLEDWAARYPSQVTAHGIA